MPSSLVSGALFGFGDVEASRARHLDLEEIVDDFLIPISLKDLRNGAESEGWQSSMDKRKEWRIRNYAETRERARERERELLQVRSKDVGFDFSALVSFS